MKKPIISEDARRFIPEWAVQRDIAVLKFKRDFEKTRMFRILQNTVEWVGKMIKRFNLD